MKIPANSDKPLLLVDVDGVLSLFGFGPQERPDGQWATVDGIPHFLSAQAGAHLLALSERFELAWCTGWEERANDYLPHLLGLAGPYPVISFDRTPGHEGAHWKLAAIDAQTEPAQPLAWIDDSFSDDCHAWAAARGASTLLVSTEPAVGLRQEHVDELLTWRWA